MMKIYVTDYKGQHKPMEQIEQEKEDFLKIVSIPDEYLSCPSCKKIMKLGWIEKAEMGYFQLSAFCECGDHVEIW